MLTELFPFVIIPDHMAGQAPEDAHGASLVLIEQFDDHLQRLAALRTEARGWWRRFFAAHGRQPTHAPMTREQREAFLCNQSCPPPTITEERRFQLLYPDQCIALWTTVEPHDPISLAVWNGNKQPRESIAFRAMARSLLRRIFIGHHVVLRSMVFSTNLRGWPPFLFGETCRRFPSSLAERLAAKAAFRRWPMSMLDPHDHETIAQA